MKSGDQSFMIGDELVLVNILLERKFVSLVHIHSFHITLLIKVKDTHLHDTVAYLESDARPIFFFTQTALISDVLRNTERPK